MILKEFFSVCKNCSKLYFKYSCGNNFTLTRSTNYFNNFNSLKRFILQRQYCNLNRNALNLSKDKSENIDLNSNEHLNKSIEISVGAPQNNFEDYNKLQIEDVSDYAPAFIPSFNFAAYVNTSPTLQEFVKLGVNLYKLERQKAVAELVLKLDFEKDVKKYLTFLHDNGVPADMLGDFITYNPLIFKEDLDNLQIRINYLKSKRFTSDMVSHIITKNPKWLIYSTKQIDSNLGHFQFTFKLTGNEVRNLTVKHPKLITYNIGHIKVITFSVKEEMGFSETEIKQILLERPRLFKSCRKDLLDRFDYIHNTMKIPHKMIADQPLILAHRLFRIKQRHSFLKSLGRDEYDPNEPNYVSLIALVTGSDSEFCQNVAKASITTFNKFQKSL